MGLLDEIVDRAIDYTNRTLQTMPSYRQTAIEGLKKLRANLARKDSEEAALARLDDYLKQLEREPPRRPRL
ncbi:MAG: hypothetical protein KGM15_11105 [Pseudomonadota bacterium]|nr:hypothetical protein [Pseudomonadota bacterium]